MSILEIVKEPSALLRQKSLPVVLKSVEELKLFETFMFSMRDIMRKEGGMGIAAIQVGEPLRALIVEIPQQTLDAHGEPITILDTVYIINPEVRSFSEQRIILPEGCLSVRQEDGVTSVRGEVERPISLSINYIDLTNTKQTLEIDGTKSDYDRWFARCLQHEMDHLDGILFIDKLYIPPQPFDTNCAGES